MKTQFIAYRCFHHEKSGHRVVQYVNGEKTCANFVSDEKMPEYQEFLANNGWFIDFVECVSDSLPNAIG